MAGTKEVCGFEVENSRLFTPGDVCCYREVWKDGHCIWHADVDNKPIKELKTSRTDFPERLDKAVLRNSDLGNSISFRNCTLIEGDLSGSDFLTADFRGTDLRGVNLSKAYLAGADLKKTDIRGADLSEGDFKGANFSKAELDEADLSETSLLFTKFNQASLWNANLSGADLEGAELTESHFQFSKFSGAYLPGADLKEAHLQEVDFSEAHLRDSELQGVKLKKANLCGADLGNVDLKDANLVRATVQGAFLEQANLSQANLFKSDFTQSELYGAVLTDIQIDKATKFGGHYESYLTPDFVDNADGSTPTPWDKACWTYRQIEQIARRNALPEQARDAFERRKDLRRREHWHRAPIPDPVRTVAEKTKSILGSPHRRLCDHFSDHPISHLWKWGRTAGSGLLMRYGESPVRVVNVSLALILICAFLYPIPGITQDPDHSPLTYANVFASDLPNALGVLGTHLYFSTVTFTTLGYGDFQPVGWARLLATVESFVGALLMALLVFVLGRRATW